MNAPSRPVSAGLGRLVKRAVRALVRFLAALARLAWNLLLVLCAVPLAAVGMLSLVCIGLLLVLLVQGYPLAGLLLCCLGLLLCCGAVLGLCVTLIWRRSRPAPAAPGGEVLPGGTPEDPPLFMEPVLPQIEEEEVPVHG